MKMNNYEILKKGFKQYLVVLNFASKIKKDIKLIDVGSQDNKLKELLPKNVTYKSLDMGGNADYTCDINKKKIPVKAKIFDITVCTETLEHVLYPDKIIEELKRVTKDDGFLILSMPNEYNFWLRLNFLFGIKREISDANLEIVAALGHIHKPRVKDIINLFSKHLEIIEVIPFWQSTSAVRSNKINNLFYSIDVVINLLAKIHPSLFARLVVVIGKKKLEK